MYALWQVPKVEYSHCSKPRTQHTHLRRRLSDTAAFVPLPLSGSVYASECCFGTSALGWQQAGAGMCGTMKQLDPTQIQTLTTK